MTGATVPFNLVHGWVLPNDMTRRFKRGVPVAGHMACEIVPMLERLEVCGGDFDVYGYSAAIGISRASCAQHLISMEAVGILESRRVPTGGRGRPRRVFSLTADWRDVIATFPVSGRVRPVEDKP